jgi:hypothetical protein
MPPEGEDREVNCKLNHSINVNKSVSKSKKKQTSPES